MDVPTEPWKQVHKEWCRRWGGGGSPFPGEVRGGTQLRTEDEVGLRVDEKTGRFFHLLAVRAQVGCRSPGLGFSICQFRGLNGLVWLQSIVALWKTPRHDAWVYYNIFPGYTQITTKATNRCCTYGGLIRFQTPTRFYWSWLFPVTPKMMNWVPNSVISCPPYCGKTAGKKQWKKRV